MPKEENLIITIDGKRVPCPRKQYVKAKTRQLKKFGYANLTEEEVDQQVTAVLEGKKLTKGLTVIGGFMQGEISKPIH